MRQEVTDEAKKCLELLEKCVTRAGELFVLIEEEQEQLLLTEGSNLRRSSSLSSTNSTCSPLKKSPRKPSTRGCVNADLSQLRKEFEKASLAEIIARQKRQSSSSPSTPIEPPKPSASNSTSSPSFTINLQRISDLLLARQDAISSFNEKLFSLFDSKSKDFSFRADDEIWRKTLKIAISSSNGDLMQPIGPIVGILSHPTHPIAQITRDFVMRLKQISLATEDFETVSKQISGEYHQFSYQMIKLLGHNYQEELEDDSLDLPLQISIESFFFSNLPALSSGIHEIFAKAFEQEDSQFLSQINRLSWLNFDHEDALYTVLNVPERYQLSTSKFEPAIQELRLASSLKCPTLQALSIVKVCDLICFAVDGEESSNSNSNSTPLGSEDLVLLLSWIIIQAQIPGMNSFFAIVSEFLPDELIRGQAGYVLATIQTAMDYIKSLN